MTNRYAKRKGINSPHFKHGDSIRNESNKRPAIYIAWVNMRQRCRNHKKWDYKFYGGRGIKICKRWDNYKNFHSDMCGTYFIGGSLDRINVNKSYSPKNCKWSTKMEQSNNRNYNRLILYKGQKYTSGVWAKKLDIKISGRELFKRIFTRGWDIDRAFHQPLRNGITPIKYNHGNARR